MDEKSEHTKKPNGNKFTPVLVAIIGAFIGSSSTVAVYVNTPLGQKITRPDPFTGSQAAVLISRIEHLEDEAGQVSQLSLRTAVLESQYANILQNQIRILDRLDQL